MGNRRLILSMGADDLKDRNAFFNGLALELRKYGYPNGTAVVSDEGLVWTFFEGKLHQSPVVLEFVMTERSCYNYSYNINGSQQSGSVVNPIDVFGVLPKRS